MLVNLQRIDTRQIPRVEEICGSKQYHDILYGYLQENSQWDNIEGHSRYVPKKLINFSKLSKALGVSRQTVSKKFQNLINLELVIEKDDKYELVILPKEVAALIPSSTLSLLVNTLNERAISVYVYLLWNFLKHNMKGYQFSLVEIKQFLGLCTTTRSNDNIITDILFVLQKIGLIEYKLGALQQETSGYKDIKTIYEIVDVTNYIKR